MNYLMVNGVSTDKLQRVYILIETKRKIVTDKLALMVINKMTEDVNFSKLRGYDKIKMASELKNRLMFVEAKATDYGYDYKHKYGFGSLKADEVITYKF